jgi:hypothetical protein
MPNGGFRYYMHAGTTALSFEIAGRVSDDGARELQQAWRTVSSVIGDRFLIVDLSYVTGIDLAGQSLVRAWHDRGAQFVAKSAQTRALLQSITGQSTGEILSAAWHPTWLPLQLAILAPFSSEASSPGMRSAAKLSYGEVTAAGNVLATSKVLGDEG